MTTFKKTLCARAARPSLFLPLITTFVRSRFIQRERNLEIWESDLKPNLQTPVRRAPPTLSHCSRARCGRRISRPRAPPFCHTPLLYTHELHTRTHSLSLTLTPSLCQILWDTVESSSSTVHLETVLTSHSPHNRLPGLQAPAACCLLLSFSQQIKLVNLVLKQPPLSNLPTHRPIPCGNTEPLVNCFDGS